MNLHKGKTLKYTRLVIGASLALLLTVSVAVPCEITRSMGAWVAKIQLLPLALSFAMAWFMLWIVATLVFGRLYCSTVCPMGALQDLAGRMARVFRGKHSLKNIYHYHSDNPRLRYTALALVAVAIVLGASIVVSVFDPYSAYSRIVLNLSHPLKAALLGLLVSLVTLVAVAAVAVRRGRLICNTVCPVGATLSVVSRYAIYHIDIDTDRCIQCRRCEHACKAECINLTDHTVDSARCVGCFNCLTDCPADAISYTSKRHQLAIPMMQRITGIAAPKAQLDTSAPAADSQLKRIDRRTFLSTSLIVAAAASTPLLAQAGRKSPRKDNVAPAPERYVLPPGVPGRLEFMDRCTGCGLCVANCPTKVIKPSTREFGLMRALHPYLDYNQSYCLVGCVVCSHVCPTGALVPLTKQEKANLHNGLARNIPSNCLSVHGIHCGMCAAVCPKSAIDMVPIETGEVPTVNPDRCIGCGACQQICPASPIKAMVVDGKPY